MGCGASGATVRAEAFARGAVRSWGGFVSEVRGGNRVGAAFASAAVMAGLAGLAVGMAGVAAADANDSGNSTTSANSPARGDHSAVRTGRSTVAAAAAARGSQAATKPAAVLKAAAPTAVTPGPAAILAPTLRGARVAAPAATYAPGVPFCVERNKYCAGEKFKYDPITNVDVSGVNFSRAVMYGNLSNTNFSDADLHDAVLFSPLGNSANVQGSNFTDAILIGIRNLRSVKGFSTTTLTGANLYEQNLDGVQLAGKNLARVNLYGATLKKAALNGADLTGADLTMADLTGANLDTALLTGANLNWADLTGANLRGIRNLKAVKGFSTATLTGANLSDQDLAGVQFNGDDLSKANLAGADLSGADLEDADLTDAVITRANLTDANLSGAKIGNATWALTDYKFLQLNYSTALSSIAPSTLAFVHSEHKLGSFTMSDNPGLRPFVQGGARPGKGGGLKFSINEGHHTATFYQDSSGEHFRVDSVQVPTLIPGNEARFYNRLVFTFTIDQPVRYSYNGQYWPVEVYLLPGDVDASAKFLKVPEPMPDWPTLSSGPNQIPSYGTLRPGTYTFWMQTKGDKRSMATLDLAPILE